MTEPMRSLYYAVSYLTEIVKLYMVVFLLLRCPRKKTKHLLVTAVFLSCTAVISLFEPGERAMTGAVTLFILATVVWELRKKRQAVLVLAAYLWIGLLDAVTGGLVCFLTRISVDELRERLWLSAFVNGLNLLFLLLLCVPRKIRKSLSPSGVRPVQPMDGALAVLLFFAAAFFIPVQKESLLEGKELSFARLTVFVLSFLALILLAVYWVGQNGRLRREAEGYGRMLAGLRSYYGGLLKKEEDTRRFRHDMDAHLSAVLQLVSQNRLDEAEDYLRTLAGGMKGRRKYHYSGNSVIDMVIGNRMEGEDIRLDFGGMFPEQSRIRDIDLCILFSNMVGNAVEAVKSLEKERWIRIRIKWMNGTAFIVCENPMDEEKEREKRGRLNGGERSERGLGMTNMNYSQVSRHIFSRNLSGSSDSGLLPV